MLNNGHLQSNTNLRQGNKKGTDSSNNKHLLKHIALFSLLKVILFFTQICKRFDIYNSIDNVYDCCFLAVVISVQG